MDRQKEKLIFNWSGGKDSAMALYSLLQEGTYDVMCLLTTLSEPYDRISMHGVRSELLELQAAHTGIPLKKLMLPLMPDMQIYEDSMRSTLEELITQGARAAAFGDIFLEDLRQYREEKLGQLGLKAVFPLWKRPTEELIREFIDAGFKTIVSCVDASKLDRSFAGRIIDHRFVDELPEGVDPCGENGEFHTFVFDGPLFQKPVPFCKGEVVMKNYTNDSPAQDSGDASKTPVSSAFWYCDLIPA
jgi:uncharacterized protein (TIGR00290 family)